MVFTLKASSVSRCPYIVDFIQSRTLKDFNDFYDILNAMTGLNLENYLWSPNIAGQAIVLVLAVHC